MGQRWTFGRTVAAGFVAMVGLTAVIGAISVVGLRQVVAANEHVLDVDMQLVIASEHMRAASNDKRAAARGFVMTGQDSYLEQMEESRRDFLSTLNRAKILAPNSEGAGLLQAIQVAESEHQQAIDAAVVLKRNGGTSNAVAAAFEKRVTPKRSVLNADLDAFRSFESRAAARRGTAADDAATSAVALVVGLVLAAVLVAGVLAFLLTRRLRRMIGRTVGEVQSSSTQLQATANQQATSAREQATAMNEITTTVTELLATSRQIAESAQRVAQIADETAGAGRSGGNTVSAAQESMADIRSQVDIIVNHMLELGEKSQRIGAVLDIVSELAEQTNILAINSTIEAAGAGEAGKRFAVVADEIRKLADRVADSTKEIRGLIDVVRSAVNTTVMATESGSKAVEGGARQFDDVAISFNEIAALVTTTTEAAREIELSTMQQSTAVEQVTVAVTNVAQATKETEASSSQTFQTATQLSELSRELQRLVESQASA